MADRDPVERGLGGSEDLYDVAEWDARSALDRFAVGIYGGFHTAGRWLLIVLGVVLFVAQLGFAAVLIADEPVLGVLALLSVVPAIALAAYLWYGDPTHREPLDTLAITFVLSIAFASIAAIVNGVFGIAFDLIPVVGTVLFFFLVVGPIEEFVKWLAIRVHAYRTTSFDAVVDGAVYGAVAGLGFATIENAIYIIQGYEAAANAADVSQIERAVGTAVGRTLVGPGHVLYSAFAGYYLGLAKFNQENRGPIVVKGLIIAAVIHAVYNSLVTILPNVLPTWNLLTLLAFIVVFDGIVGYALYRKISRYRSHYRRAQSATPSDVETAPDEA